VSPPLVSAAVVAYNQADLLRETVTSVLAQTYPNIEIVVGDDGSTDGTPDLLRELQREVGPRMRLVLSSDNGGITANCNRVLRACRGEYVAWLGGDDLWLPTKVEAQVTDLEAHPEAALSHHAVEVFDERGGTTVINALTPRRSTPAQLAEHCFINGSSLLHRRAAAVDGFDADLVHGSDWLFYFRLAMRGAVLRTPGVLGRYRRHGGQVTDPSTPFRRTVIEDYLRGLDRMEELRPDVARQVRRGRMAVWTWQWASARSTNQPSTGYLVRGIRANPSPRDLAPVLKNAAVSVMAERSETVRRRVSRPAEEAGT
jgi:glycosyltransferase involved in cell wall biosynthesis